MAAEAGLFGFDNGCGFRIAGGGPAWGDFMIGGREVFNSRITEEVCGGGEAGDDAGNADQQKNALWENTAKQWNKSLAGLAFSVAVRSRVHGVERVSSADPAVNGGRHAG